MTESFRARFEAMVAELRANRRVQIYELVVRPPASEADLRDAEEAIGRPLPAELRAFYAAHDGVFIEWGIRDREYGSLTDPFEYPDYGQAPGCINLLPVGDAMSPAWERDYHVNEIQPDHQALLFGAPLDPPPKVAAVCIDNFSKYNHGDLVLGPEPVMVVSTDHGADMDSSDYATFSVYLDLTLAIYGTNRYARGLGIGWSRKSQRVSAWTERATLETLLDEVEAEAQAEE